MAVEEVKSELSAARQKLTESDALAASIKSQLEEASKRQEDFAAELKSKEDAISNLLEAAEQKKSESADDSRDQLEKALKRVEDMGEQNASQAEKITVLEESNRSLNAEKEQLARNAVDHEGRVARDYP